MLQMLRERGERQQQKITQNQTTFDKMMNQDLKRENIKGIYFFNRVERQGSPIQFKNEMKE